MTTDPGSSDPAGTTTEPQEEDVTEVVEGWLSAAGSGFELNAVAVTDSEITVDMVSADTPPPIEDLTARLEDELALLLPVVVNWTQRTTLHGTDPDEQLRRELEAAASEWVRDQESVTVSAISVDGRNVVVDLAGPTPGDVDSLREMVRDIAGEGVAIDIWLTPRQLLPAT